MTESPRGVAASELSDEELETQGLHAHETRNWVFLHGNAEQYAHHTARMLELEHEYLRRHPKRTWQGSGGAANDPEQTAASWRETVRSVIEQLTTLVQLPDPAPAPSSASTGGDPATVFLRALAEAPGGRMHKLEAHQAAREAGLDRAGLADLYKSDPPLVSTEGGERVITDAGRQQLST